MYDLTQDFQIFYDTHVRLGSDRRKRLADRRDLNIDRLKGGLDDLAAESGRARPHPYDWKNQGGYAMHTLNQDPRDDNDYDIDVAVIFEKSDLPSSPLAARQRVAEALCRRCANFTQEPTARTNAVTIYYSEGYHIDFAVFRTYTDEHGVFRIEHASTEWKRRDPDEINQWFQKKVTDLSPAINIFFDASVTVKTGQFRRIVRFLKFFSKSRSSWSLPGGLIVSTLAAESYRSNATRDDRALYDTIVAMRDRLTGNNRVFNPVDYTEFTADTERLNEVKRLHSKLDLAVGKLAVLWDPNCSRSQARSAWDWVFNHVFWGGAELAKAALDESATRTAVSAYSVSIECGLSRTEGGRVYKTYTSGSSVLPKNIHLRFTVTATNVPAPYQVIWEVQNQGDEAAEHKQLSWSTGPISALERWTTTAFKGQHRMICKIEKDGATWAQTSHIVKVARGRWARG